MTLRRDICRAITAPDTLSRTSRRGRAALGRSRRDTVLSAPPWATCQPIAIPPRGAYPAGDISRGPTPCRSRCTTLPSRSSPAASPSYPICSTRGRVTPPSRGWRGGSRRGAARARHADARRTGSARQRLGEVRRRPPHRNRAPAFADEEATIAALRERCAKTVAYLGQLHRDGFADSEARSVTFGSKDAPWTLVGDAYLLSFALPNFFFHVTTAYDILRHKGCAGREARLSRSDPLGAEQGASPAARVAGRRSGPFSLHAPVRSGGTGGQQSPTSALSDERPAFSDDNGNVVLDDRPDGVVVDRLVPVAQDVPKSDGAVEIGDACCRLGVETPQPVERFTPVFRMGPHVANLRS